MSDVMPYRSTRFADLGPDDVAAYRGAWLHHVAEAVRAFEPDLIHAHHVWIMGASLKDVAPDIPIVTHCHATGFRQMTLCPHLAVDVREGCRRNDAFCVLHEEHGRELQRILDVPADVVHTVGAGYREDLFHPRGAAEDRGNNILYIGKYSAAKGLPWLLDAVESLAARHPGLTLHVAGGGAGAEAEALEARMADLAGCVVRHGQLSQLELAGLMRRCAVCVLPSFYEGVPLVLVEALACGCRLVATRLPGVVDQLAPALGEAMTLVPLPRLEAVDVPHAPDLPAFVEALETALADALDAPPPDVTGGAASGALEPFAWSSVFDRVERIWLDLLDEGED